MGRGRSVAEGSLSPPAAAPLVPPSRPTPRIPRRASPNSNRKAERLKKSVGCGGGSVARRVELSINDYVERKDRPTAQAGTPLVQAQRRPCARRPRSHLAPMRPPIFVREPSAAERARLEAGLRASDAFTVRRAPIVPASAEGRRPRAIARDPRCATRTVRDGVRAFDAAGPERRLVAAEERRAGPGRGRAGAAARDPAPAAARLRPRPEHLDPRPPGARGARARAGPGRPLGGD